MTDGTRRPPRWAPLVLLALLTAAAVVGAAADRIVLARQGRLAPFGLPPAGAFGEPSAADEAEILAHLKAALDVTPAQAPRVEAIVRRQVGELRGLRREVLPRVTAIFERTRVALDSVLTPAQQARRDALLRRVAPFVDSAAAPGR